MRLRLLCMVALAVTVAVVFAGAAAAPRALAAGRGQSLCIAHHPQDFVWYTSSCTGHDGTKRPRRNGSTTRGELIQPT